MPTANPTAPLIVLLCLLCAAAPAAEPDAGLVTALRALATPLRGEDDLAPLLSAAGTARLALLGEATHGTREFYRWRARITQRLIAGRGFSFVAFEGDWVSLSSLDRYVRDLPGAPVSADAALRQIAPWPQWVWANPELASFAEWLRSHNQGRALPDRVGIHGIDLYPVTAAAHAVLAFARDHWPAQAAAVAAAYGPLLTPGEGAYATAVAAGAPSAQRGAAWVVDEFSAGYRAAAAEARWAWFEAVRQARVVASGEAYLRDLGRSGPAAWNDRARHMAEALTALLAHYGPDSRGVVWAHNTHIGDARETAMVEAGEINLGQLLRERLGTGAVFALGFGTASGTVRAARHWEGPGEVMTLPPPRPDSLEAALLTAGGGDRLLRLDPGHPATAPLDRPLPHRAIGAVFVPADEPVVNYVATRLARRYDAFVFLPRTQALGVLGGVAD